MHTSEPMWRAWDPPAHHWALLLSWSMTKKSYCLTLVRPAQYITWSPPLLHCLTKCATNEPIITPYNRNITMVCWYRLEFRTKTVSFASILEYITTIYKMQQLHSYPHKISIAIRCFTMLKQSTTHHKSDKYEQNWLVSKFLNKTIWSLNFKILAVLATICNIVGQHSTNPIHIAESD